MASSTAYRAQLNNLRQGYLSRNDLHSKAASPPEVVAVENLIDLTSYEEEYDYLVSRRRAVSSTTPATAATRTDDATSRFREVAKSPRRKQATGQSRDDEDDYDQIARMLSLNQSESNPRPLDLNIEKMKTSDRLDSSAYDRATQRSLATASPRSLASTSSPSRNFPSSLSLQIRDELEEIKKVTATSSADDDSGDKDSIIRLEDILGSTKGKSNGAANDRRVYSPDPIPATPSLEADYHASGKQRGDKRIRNDPDKLRVLTPEPIPTSPSLETELTLRSRRSFTNREVSSRHVAVETIPESIHVEEGAESRNRDGHPQPTLKKASSYRMPPGDSDGVIDVGDRKQTDGANQMVSKTVSFHGETRPIISVVDTDDKDIYGNIEIPGGSGIDGAAGSGSLWSPSYESDPMLGSKSMYRRAIMARRRKSAARTVTDTGGGAGSGGAAPTSLASSNGGAFKPIEPDYEELEKIDLTSPSMRGNPMADKYRSLAISPVKSSIDQDDSFWILSPSPRRSPQDGGIEDDDTREEEDGERSSLEGDKREKDDASRLPTGNGALLLTKSMSPTVERRMRLTKREFDYDDIRTAKSLSFRQAVNNLPQSNWNNPSRDPPIIDVESKVSGSDIEVKHVPSNGTTHSSPRSASPRRYQSSPQLSERSSPSCRLHLRSSIPESSSRDQHSSALRDGESLVPNAHIRRSESDVLNLVSDIPGIPAAKSEPGGWRARGDEVLSVDDLEIPKVLTEPKKKPTQGAGDATFVRSLPHCRREGSASTDIQRSVPSKFVSEFLDEPIIAPDLVALSIDHSDVVSTRSKSPQRMRVTPETPNRPARSLVQQKLSAEIRKTEELMEPLQFAQGRDSPHQCVHPVIDAEDFSNVVNGGGGEIQAIDSVNKLVSTFDDDDGGTDVAFEAPIPKPYSKDLAISESESSTSQLEPETNVETMNVTEEGTKRKPADVGSLQSTNDPKGIRVENESECENTSGDDSYAVGQRKYRKYSSDENGGQTSGNETDSKLSIINSESSESELGVDPDLDPHVLYDSEAMRFVVQILDRSCAWLEDDGCSCNFQGQPSSLLREIKKKSRAGPIPTGGLENSQAPTPRASNSKRSRVSGKASSLVRMAAKQNPGGPLVQKLQIDKERRSQRSSLPPPEGDEGNNSSQGQISVFARPRRRQASPRRPVLPDSDTGSSDDRETGQRSPQRSPPRRRRSQSPRKRSSAKDETKFPSPIRSTPITVIEEPTVIQVEESDEPPAHMDSDSAISPFQKKLQERLASVRGQSQSDSSVGPEVPEASSPVSQSVERDEVQRENSEVGERGRGNRSPSPARRPIPQPQSQASVSTFNARSSPPAVDARPLAVSNIRTVAADSSGGNRSGFRSASPGSISGRYSLGSPEKARPSSQPKNQAPGSRIRVESSVVVGRTNPSSARDAAKDPKEPRSQRTQPRKAGHGDPRSRRSKTRPPSSSEEPPAALEKVPVAPQQAAVCRPGPSSASSVNSGSGGPEQRRRGDQPPPHGGVLSASSFASASQLSSASFVSRGPDSRLETIHEQLTPRSSAASSPSASSIFGRSSPFHGLTEAERLAALELAEKLRRRASNLKRRRRAREKRMNQFLTDEEDEDPALN